MQQICDDLHAEYLDARSMVDGLSDEGWAAPTPSEGWDVRDQIAHLAFFDEKALFSHEHPADFAAEVAELIDPAVMDAMMEATLAQGRAKSGPEVLAWWDEAHDRLVSIFRGLDPKTRVLWYGPEMSARSKITARLMETWAHGQDVADALGVERAPTDRLRHVCHIGVRARTFAYLANGLTPPSEEVYVELVGPSGAVWTWGDPDGANQITGSGLDFALVATQRRHRDDTDLIAVGPVATEWLGIAQAFAGPPGPGRQPGQFA